MNTLTWGVMAFAGGLIALFSLVWLACQGVDRLGVWLKAHPFAAILAFAED